METYCVLYSRYIVLCQYTAAAGSHAILYLIIIDVAIL